MHPLVEQNREAIKAVCRRYGVKRLEVFGSAARAVDFDPARSDVDFLVEFSEDSETGKSLGPFLEFRGDLMRILGRPVDLVSRENLANPYVKAEVERNREPVHAA
ncbi:nucleotidyltransferase family protein [Thioalkalivibrio sp. ALM2T]|uniref:nucleotidyltransferase family protein n=1 Tax=Thioalkalivibrio sp. ALM2T TaxID=1158184 RepID=UPI0009DA4DDC|nr:nucleotidyltransferase domain-containing protein [Thioalkalivibrio sp. ALM2T]